MSNAKNISSLQFIVALQGFQPLRLLYTQGTPFVLNTTMFFKANKRKRASVPGTVWASVGICGWSVGMLAAAFSFR